MRQYGRLEHLKEQVSTDLDKNSLASMYLSLDRQRKGFISFEDLNFWLADRDAREVSRLEWDTMLARLSMIRNGKSLLPGTMLFVDLFDLVFPLSNLGEYGVIGSTSAQFDSKFKMFLGTMDKHMDKHLRFTKQSGASVTESEQVGANLGLNGSLSQRMQETLGILELKYEGMSEEEEDGEGADMPGKGLANAFSFYPQIRKEYISNGEPKPRINSFEKQKQEYESETQVKKRLFWDSKVISIEPHERREEGYFTNQFSSTKSDKVNCLWEIHLSKSKETSGKNSQYHTSPKFQTNSGHFHREGIPMGLCLDDYEEIVETFTFLEGRHLKPRARGLLEASAQHSIFN